jgi:hypothetical protein
MIEWTQDDIKTWLEQYPILQQYEEALYDACIVDGQRTLLKMSIISQTFKLNSFCHYLFPTISVQIGLD